MRVRVAIYRHLLPPVKIWWDTRTSLEPGDDLTISTFLERLSQVVPLDSSTWGLEDYIVEIDGFELLHFQNIEQIVKENDTVVVRPLSGSEIRERKISGRRQVSTSGRKLIDGTPFGRTMLRPAPDRPGVMIPPRKRVKFGKHSPDSTTLALQEGSSEEEDEEQEVAESEEEEHGESNEEGEHDQDEDMQDAADSKPADRSKKSVALIDYYADEDEEEDDEEYQASASEGSLSDDEGASEDDLPAEKPFDLFGEEGSDEEDDDYQPVDPVGLSEEEEDDFSSEEESDSESVTEEVASKSMPESDIANDTNIFEQDYNEEEDEDYNPIDPVGLSEDDEEDADSMAEEFVAKYKKPSYVLAPQKLVDSPVEKSIEKQAPTVESSKSSESSESDAESASESAAATSESEASSDSSSSNESENESSSEEESSAADSSSEESVDEQPLIKIRKRPVLPDSRDDSENENENEELAIKLTKESSTPKSKNLAVAPGSLPNQGSTASHARNARKKNGKKLVLLKKHDIVPGIMTVVPLRLWLDENNLSIETPIEDFLQRRNSNALTDATEFLAKFQHKTPEATTANTKLVTDDVERERSLSKENSNDKPKTVQLTGKARKNARKIYRKSLERGQIKEGLDFDQWLEERQRARESTEAVHENDDTKNVDESIASISAQRDESPAEETSKRPSEQGPISDTHHRKYAQAFGSSNKKWKKMQNKAPTRMVYDEYGNAVEVEPTEETPVVDEDPDAWREKIILSAVECEDENVKELPTPDFPFDQSQLKTNFNAVNVGKKRKRGGKKRKPKGQVEDYYDRDEIDYEQEDQWIPHDFYEDAKSASAENGMEEAEKDSEPVDDLPSLPEDIAALYPLIKPVRPKTVIAFKQFGMNENYNPIITDYLTAIVEEVDEEVAEGPLLVLKLAIRDRPKKNIDPETGERILGRFEMPGAEEVSDEGIQEIMFGALIEPKVLQLPEADPSPTPANGEESKGADTNGDGQGSSGEPSHETNGDGQGEPAEEQQPDEMDEDQSHMDAEPTCGQQPSEEAQPETEHLDNMENDSGDQGDEQSVHKEAREDIIMDGGLGSSFDDPVATSSVVPEDPSTGQLPAAQEPQFPISPQPYIPESDYTPTTPARRQSAEPNEAQKNDIHKSSAELRKYESDTDSDGFPSLHTILSQNIKKEPQDENRQPSLPPLPEFSPMGMDIGPMRIGGPAERQILAEASNTISSTAPPRMQKTSDNPKQVQKKRHANVKVIDLTLDSSPPPGEEEEPTKAVAVARTTGAENKKREFPWKAVKRRNI